MFHSSISSARNVQSHDDFILNFSNTIKNLGPLSSTIFCGAHTFQLAAFDVEKTVREEIAQIRHFVKETRKIKYKELFNEFSYPVLDNDTRWSSTFLMVESVWKNKTSYLEISDRNLRKLSSKLPWTFIEEFCECFSIINDAMKLFQKAELTIGEPNETMNFLIIFVFHVNSTSSGFCVSTS